MIYKFTIHTFFLMELVFKFYKKTFAFSDYEYTLTIQWSILVG